MSIDTSDPRALQAAVDEEHGKEQLMELSDPEIRDLLREKHRLENELLRYQVNQMKTSIQSSQAHHDQVERDLADAQRQIAIRQYNCSHRKGGKGMAGVQGGGQDPQFSVFKHQLPNGDWMVLCSRCQKEWNRPLAGDPKYVELLDQYKKALALPTDNVASGGSQFSFVGVDGRRVSIDWKTARVNESPSIVDSWSL